jgi:hypothetical protein
MSEADKPSVPGLFGAQAAGLPARSHGGARDGAGRKPNTQNRLSRDLARYLRGRAVETHGREPIELDFELLNRDMASDGAELQAFADHLGCTRLEAFREWRALKREVYPRVYPTLASIEVKAPGAPGAEELAEVEGDIPTIDGTFQRVPD